jgi:tetratricopeptide (TPR) repeat protein
MNLIAPRRRARGHDSVYGYGPHRTRIFPLIATAVAFAVLFGALAGTPRIAHADQEWLRAMSSARTALDSGDSAEARRWLDSAARRAKNFSADDWRLTGTVHNIGVAHLARGAFIEAATALERARDEYTQLFGARSAPLVQSSIALALLAQARGDSKAARTGFEEALQTASSLNPADAVGAVPALLGLADLTDDPKAKTALLRRAARSAAGDDRAEAQVTMTQAIHFASSGDRTQSLTALDASSAALAKVEGSAFALATVQYVKGTIALEWGDVTRAVGELRDAVEAMDNAGVRDHANLVNALLTLADALALTGASRDADAAMSRATTMAPRAVDAKHPLLHSAMLSSARFALNQGNYQDALERTHKLANAKLSAPDSALLSYIRGAAGIGLGDLGPARAGSETLKTLAAQKLSPTDQVAVALAHARLEALQGNLDAAHTGLSGVLGTREGLGLDGHPEQARIATELAAVNSARLGPVAAEEYILKAVDLVKRAMPDGGSVVVDALTLQAGLERAQGRLTNAASTLAEATAQAASALGETSLRYAELTRVGARVQGSAGKSEIALAGLSGALGAAQKLLPSRHPKLLAFQLALVDEQVRAGKLREAAATLRAATSSAGKLKGGPKVAHLKLMAAAVDAAQGRTRETLKSLKAGHAALQGWPRSTRTERIEVQLTLASAELEARSGDSPSALAALGAAPSDPTSLLNWTIGRASILAEAGDHQSALTATTQLRSRIEAGPPGSTLDQLLTTQALAHAALGQYAEALTVARSALQLARTRFGDEHVRTQSTKLTVANIHARTGQLADAQTAIDEVVETIGRTSGEDHPNLVAALVEKGTLERIRSDTAAALLAFTRAQAIREKFQRSDHPDVLELSLQRATTLAGAGQLTEAQNLFSRIASQVRRSGNPRHPILVEVHLGTASLNIVRYQLTAARKDLELAEQIADSYSSTHPLQLRVKTLQIRATLAGGDASEALKQAESLLKRASASPARTPIEMLAARAAIEAGLLTRAAELIGDAKKRLEESAGAAHLNSIGVSGLGARLAAEQGRWSEAETTLRDSLRTLEDMAPEHRQSVVLQTQLAGVLLQMGRVNEALEVAELARALAEERLGVEHVNYADAQTIHALANSAIGQTSEAEADLKSAQAAHERTIGAAHPRTIADALALARLQASQGRLADAASVLSRAHGVALRAAGKRKASAALAAVTLQQGWLGIERGELQSARAAFQEVTRIASVLGGAQTIRRASSQAGAAMVALRQDNLEDAEKFARDAAAMGGDVPGGVQITSLAKVVASAVAARRGDLSAATAQAKAALSAIEGRFGADHLASLDLLETLGGLWLHAGQPREAVVYMEQARSLSTTALGGAHARSLRASLAVVHARIAAGDMEGAAADFEGITIPAELGDMTRASFDVARAAIAHHRQDRATAIDSLTNAVELSERQLGAKHPLYAERLTRLAAEYVDAARAGEAEPLLRRSLSILELSLGKEHFDLAAPLGHLGRAHAALGRTASAVSYFERQVGILENAFGPSHSSVEPALVNLAALQAQTNQAGKGLENLRRAREIAIATSGTDNLRKAHASQRLAGALVKAGQHAEARTHYGEALAILETLVDVDDPTLRDTIASLAALDLLRGDYDSARALLERIPKSG